MEKKLESYLYVYRKSYKMYNDISLSLSVSKFIFSASGLTAFVMLPLASLSIIAGIIEILDKSLKIAERKEEYKHCFKFYKSLLNSYRSKTLTEEQILAKEEEFIKDLNFFPIEKYIKKRGLNGY